MGKISGRPAKKQSTSGTLRELRRTPGERRPAYNVNLTKRALPAKNGLEAYTMYFDAIAKIVSERTGCDISAVKPESKFSELGIDSLDTVELLMSLEDEIGMEIELDQKVETIDDLDRFIQSKQG